MLVRVSVTIHDIVIIVHLRAFSAIREHRDARAGRHENAAPSTGLAYFRSPPKARGERSGTSPVGNRHGRCLRNGKSHSRPTVKSVSSR